MKLSSFSSKETKKVSLSDGKKL